GWSVQLPAVCGTAASVAGVRGGPDRSRLTRMARPLSAHDTGASDHCTMGDTRRLSPVFSVLCGGRMSVQARSSSGRGWSSSRTTTRPAAKSAPTPGARSGTHLTVLDLVLDDARTTGSRQSEWTVERVGRPGPSHATLMTTLPEA